MTDSYIEDETSNSYTIRTDKLKEGEVLQCRDDSDMKIKKENNDVYLIKKSFSKNCFSQ